jgi:hypothetical protein
LLFLFVFADGFLAGVMSKSMFMLYISFLPCASNITIFYFI